MGATTDDKPSNEDKLASQLRSTSISLKFILVVLMAFNLFMFFVGQMSMMSDGILGAGMFIVFSGGPFPFLLTVIGLLGAVHKRPGFLAAYVIISFILAFICFLGGVLSMFLDDAESDGEVLDLTSAIFMGIVVVIVAFLKIYSLQLAWKLKTIIRLVEPVLPTDSKDSQLHEFKPNDTSCAVEQQEATLSPLSPPADLPAQPTSTDLPAQPSLAFPQYPFPAQFPLSAQFPGQMPGFSAPGMYAYYPYTAFNHPNAQQPIYFSYAPAPQSNDV